MKVNQRIQEVLNWSGVREHDSRLKISLRRISVRFFSRPDMYSRYKVLLDALNKFGNKSDRILEVGSGSSGLTRYTTRRIYSTDIDFTGVFLGRSCHIKASSAALPLKDDSFDFVISADLLEHLSEELRRQTLSEMVRVARCGVLAIAPSGKESMEVENKLFNWLERKKMNIPRWMREHREFGLPEESKVKDILTDAVAQYTKRSSIEDWKTSNLRLCSLTWRVFIAAETSSLYRALTLIFVFLTVWPFSFLWYFGRGYRCYWQVLFEKETNGSLVRTSPSTRKQLSEYLQSISPG